MKNVYQRSFKSAPPPKNTIVEWIYRSVIRRPEGRKTRGQAAICEQSSRKNMFLPLIGLCSPKRLSIVLGEVFRMGFKYTTRLLPTPAPSLIREGKPAFTLAEGATHVAMWDNQRKIAFTLAEVLITLGIIGVVAAMTMPTIIGHYKRQETLSRLKKAYSIINQALKMSEAANGEYEYWDSGFDVGAKEYLNKYWLPYFNVLKICNNSSECNYDNDYPYKLLNGNSYSMGFASNSRRIPFITTDGILFSISIGAGTNEALSVDSTIYIDINGSKEPNTLGKDYFMFKLVKNKGILPNGYNTDQNKIYANCSKTGSGEYCAQWIMMNGWQFPKDYPY